MTFDQLKEKAAMLPLAPGVYIMRDKQEQVIYVGKAKKLKNRVSQYFQDTATHTPKTRMMVSKIDHFDVIVAASEFEALVLECSLIKRYAPKYNILLKDDKGYPYLRIDMHQVYPRITMVNRISDDGANYFGPFGSRSITQDIMKEIHFALKLPTCSKQFPRDIGKDRPCLNYHMNQCSGWCQDGMGSVEYRKRIEQACQLMAGNYKSVAAGIKNEMLAAADVLNFELAANLRDRLKAVEALGQKQLVTAGTLADMDVIGFAQNDTKACFTVLHFSGGNLLDKDYEILSSQESPEVIVTSLLKQFYLSRGYAAKLVLLPFEIEDGVLYEQLLEQKYGKRPRLKVPQRGENVRLVELAMKNAFEELQRVASREERNHGAIALLGKMLAISMPKRIESYDISNISGTDIVASMVVYQDGKPKKSEYKHFKIENLTDQDDYASMQQVLSRRFVRYLNQDAGFENKPDLILIDGGFVHAQMAVKALEKLALHFPVIGMVKDNRHRTRALVTPEGLEIRIDSQQTVFSLIGNIQEETHRFAITYHRSLRSKRLRQSRLDGIAGVGEKRKQELIRFFKSISAISQASVSELERVLPSNVALNVYNHFHDNQEKGE